MAIQVNTVQATSLITDCIKAQLVPMITGSPGQGKSAIVHAIAEEYNLAVIDVRLSQCDPTDLLGLPSVNKETGRASYSPMDIFPLEGDSLPKGKEGWLLFFDEMNSAPMSVQAACYKITLDRQIGQYNLHDKVAIVCAGNLDTDNAIVNRLSTAMQSRLVHLELTTDMQVWLDWASANGIDYRIGAYINFKPDNLLKFSPDHSDKTFPCPRTWEFVSRLIEGWKEIPDSKIPLLAGTVSEGVAREFFTFCKIFQELPTVQQILKDPKNIKVPTDPGTLYALSGSIGHHAGLKNMDTLMEYVIRMPVEFQVITLKDIIKRKPECIDAASVSTWIQEKGDELFS